QLADGIARARRPQVDLLPVAAAYQDADRAVQDDVGAIGGIALTEQHLSGEEGLHGGARLKRALLVQNTGEDVGLELPARGAAVGAEPVRHRLLPLALVDVAGEPSAHAGAEHR